MGYLLTFCGLQAVETVGELPSSSASLEQIASEFEGFEPLFDGVGFSGWKTNEDIRRVWRVEDGKFAATPGLSGKHAQLWTEKHYRNFELIVDWRLPQKPGMRSRAIFTPDGLYVYDNHGKQIRKDILDAGDSGIFLRGDPNYQVNIWCQPMGSGDIQEIHKDPSLSEALRRAMLPRVNADAPFGEWNRFHITLMRDRVSVKLNGVVVVRNALLPGIPSSGPIGLQYHRDEIEFKNLFIKEI